MDDGIGLSERLADRLCHDVASSAQAIASGVDLLREAKSQGERDEAVALLIEALGAQTFKVRYARRAFGPGAQPAATAELKALALGFYADLRPSLEWLIPEATMDAEIARALLVLLQIAAEALAAGGITRVQTRSEEGRAILVVEAEGPRAALRDEVRAGLVGAPFAAGLGGRWVHGAFVAALIKRGGGDISVEARAGAVVFRVTLPSRRTGPAPTY